MKKVLPLLVLLILNFLLKIPFTSQGFFAFTYDQGRDLLVVSRMVYEGKLTLIGPTTGLQGIFYGPTWYWFLAPLLFLSGGNPQGVANFMGAAAILTIFSIYFLIKYITKNPPLALSLSLVASMSKSWMFAPTLIWSPSLVTFFMVLLFFSVYKIFTSPKPVYFFLLGLLTVLVGDGGEAFGVILTAALLLSPLVFRKQFARKEFLLSILGAFFAASPRIIFDFKHDFLITKSVISYFNQPQVYGAKLSIFERTIEKLDLFWGIFSDSFTRGNKTAGVVFFILLLTAIVFILRNKKMASEIKTDGLFKYCVFLIITLFIGFTYYPDIVWDYYLVGLPIIFLTLISRVFAVLLKKKNLNKITAATLLLLILINFNKGLLNPFKITWLGDGATYRNQKMVMDHIASQNPHEYSFYAFYPAIFDYPFDYLFYWYSKNEKIEAPKDRQNIMFLLIREASSKKYLTSGWYGDKTRDKTTILESESFAGDLVLEKHQVK